MPNKLKRVAASFTLPIGADLNGTYLRALEERGFLLDCSPGSYGNRVTRAIKWDVAVELELNERGSHKPPMFTINLGHCNDYQTNWNDTDKSRLEDRLNSVVEGILKIALHRK